MNEEKTVPLENIQIEVVPPPLDETAQAEVKKHEEKGEEGPVLLRRFTLDGEVLVEKHGKDYNFHPLKEVPLIPVPACFKEIHMTEMKMFHSLVKTIKKAYPKRTVPVTRKELFRSGATSKLIQQLIEMGYLKEELVDFYNSEGKNTGSRSCFYYTPQGRALIRERLEADYAKTGYN